MEKNSRGKIFIGLHQGHFDSFLSSHKINIDRIQTVRHRILHTFPLLIDCEWLQILRQPNKQVSRYHEIVDMIQALQESIAEGSFDKLEKNRFFSECAKETEEYELPSKNQLLTYNYFLEFNQTLPKDFSIPSQEIFQTKKSFTPKTIQLAQFFITSAVDTYATKLNLFREPTAADVRHSTMAWLA